MKAFQSLSDSEMEIMEVIWASAEPMTASQLLDNFAHKDWKIQTMNTFLTRLVEKGVLSTSKQGRTNLYSPAVTREGYHRLAARNEVGSLDATNPGPASVVRLCGSPFLLTCLAWPPPGALFFFCGWRCTP